MKKTYQLPVLTSNDIVIETRINGGKLTEGGMPNSHVGAVGFGL